MAIEWLGILASRIKMGSNKITGKGGYMTAEWICDLYERIPGEVIQAFKAHVCIHKLTIYYRSMLILSQARSNSYLNVKHEFSRAYPICKVLVQLCRFGLVFVYSTFYQVNLPKDK